MLILHILMKLEKPNNSFTSTTLPFNLIFWNGIIMKANLSRKQFLIALTAAALVISTPTLTAAQTTSPSTPSTSSAPSAEQVRGFVKRYFEGTRSMNAKQWASAFSDQAVVEDPVGTPALRGELILKQGESFVQAFREVGLTEGYVNVQGLQAVAYWTGRGTTAQGQRVRFEGINVFEFDRSGKIISLKGYWSPAEMKPE
jgi:steroid Delta-isomerase